MMNATVHFDIMLLEDSSVKLHTKYWELMEMDRETETGG